MMTEGSNVVTCTTVIVHNIILHEAGARSIEFLNYLLDVNNINRGSYMSAHVLLNLLNESGKR